MAEAQQMERATWRDYKELTKGTITDLVNASGKRKAGTIYAASFLEEFVGETPWAHLDIAGSAWKWGGDDGATGRPVGLLTQFLLDRAGS